MKNFTLLFIALAFGLQANAQITLSHNTDPVTVNHIGLACWDTPTANEYRDNSNARVYNLNEFNITGDFDISAVKFGQGIGDDGKDLKVIIYTSDSEHLTAATLTLIAEEEIILEAVNNNSVVTVPITATIPAGSIVVVETYASDEGTATDLKFFPGFNFNGETDFSWVKVPDCGAPVWRITEEFQTNQQYLINLVGEEVLGLEDHFLSEVMSYPNPTFGNFTIKLNKNYSTIEAQIINILGQNIGSSRYTNRDTLNLKIEGKSGVYFIKINTSEGKSKTLRVIKK